MSILPGIYLQVVYNVYRRWLNSMGQTFATMIVALISAALFVPTVYIFAVSWGMGIKGLAYAFVLYRAF